MCWLESSIFCCIGEYCIWGAVLGALFVVLAVVILFLAYVTPALCLLNVVECPCRHAVPYIAELVVAFVICLIVFIYCSRLSCCVYILLFLLRTCVNNGAQFLLLLLTMQKWNSFYIDKVNVHFLPAD